MSLILFSNRIYILFYRKTILCFPRFVARQKLLIASRPLRSVQIIPTHFPWSPRDLSHCWLLCAVTAVTAVCVNTQHQSDCDRLWQCQSDCCVVLLAFLTYYLSLFGDCISLVYYCILLVTIIIILTLLMCTSVLVWLCKQYNYSHFWWRQHVLSVNYSIIFSNLSVILLHILPESCTVFSLNSYYCSYFN